MTPTTTYTETSAGRSPLRVIGWLSLAAALLSLTIGAALALIVWALS